MKIDMHVHTRQGKSTSFMNRDDIIETAAERGLDGIIITDHNTILPAEELKAYRNNNRGLKVFQGVEVATSGFHFLVIGHLEFLPLTRETTPRELIKTAHSSGNFVAIAHPYRRAEDVLPEWAYSQELDGVEVKSFNIMDTASQRKSLELAKSLGCLAIAGTDHHPGTDRVGKIGVELEADPQTEHELVMQLKSGKFKIFDNLNSWAVV